jgi:hypothetical protein
LSKQQRKILEDMLAQLKDTGNGNVLRPKDSDALAAIGLATGKCYLEAKDQTGLQGTMVARLTKIRDLLQAMPTMQTGGLVGGNGLVYLHAGERVLSPSETEAYGKLLAFRARDVASSAELRMIPTASLLQGLQEITRSQAQVLDRIAGEVRLASAVDEATSGTSTQTLVMALREQSAAVVAAEEQATLRLAGEMRAVRTQAEVTGGQQAEALLNLTRATEKVRRALETQDLRIPRSAKKG